MDQADKMAQGRQWLKASGWAEFSELSTDQRQRIAAPPLQEPVTSDSLLTELPRPRDLAELLPRATASLLTLINQRQSRRKFTSDDLALEELAYLLWCTQGVREIAASGKACLRTVPSGGARHCFETYLAVQRVAKLQPGLYRYLALSHQLAWLGSTEDWQSRISAACMNQRTAGLSAVLFAWSAVPYRAEWRYSAVAHKMIAIDAGHVCQNLYLACEALGLGCCAIGAYHQQLLDELIKVDGANEFAIYAAAVGRV